MLISGLVVFDLRAATGSFLLALTRWISVGVAVRTRYRRRHGRVAPPKRERHEPRDVPSRRHGSRRVGDPASPALRLKG
jgi:hypothetical protein